LQLATPPPPNPLVDRGHYHAHRIPSKHDASRTSMMSPCCSTLRQLPLRAAEHASHPVADTSPCPSPCPLSTQYTQQMGPFADSGSCQLRLHIDFHLCCSSLQTTPDLVHLTVCPPDSYSTLHHNSRQGKTLSAPPSRSPVVPVKRGDPASSTSVNPTFTARHMAALPWSILKPTRPPYAMERPCIPRRFFLAPRM
jgi:hypothetical protein